MELSLPRGMKDLSITESQKKKEIISVIEDMFKRFGFCPLETPSMENSEVLNAKNAAGDEALKEVYTLDDGQTALRFDFTVPLARYMAMNKDLHLPFKRYQIGNIWRKEEPQKMRYREFTQADIDIVGSKELISDAEVVAAAAMALESLGVRDCTIYINNRMILEKIMRFYKVPEGKVNSAIRIIDKMHKLGVDQITAQIQQLGLTEEDARGLVEFISTGENIDELSRRIETNIKDAKPDLDKVLSLISLIEKYNIESRVRFDASLARGLDYYTSFVWEFVILDSNEKRLPSVVSGGRFDSLIEVYSKKPTPATGISIGIDRLIDILPKDRASGIVHQKVFVAYLTEEDQVYALNVANTFRANGICTDFNTTQRNLAKQLEYANAMNFKYVAIIGKNEREEKRVRLKRLETGDEEMLNVQEALEVLKG